MDPILVATDLSARADRAVTRAAALAKAAGAPLRILTVVDDDRPNELVLAEETEARRALEAQAKTLDGVEATVMVETGHLLTMIPKIASETNASLVVLGAHRSRGLSELLGRPNLARILLGLDRPALVVLGRPERPYAHVLAGIDFSPAGKTAAQTARRVAPEAKMTLGHVFVVPDMGIAQATHAALEYTQAEHDRQEEALRLAAAEIEGPTPAIELRSGPAAPTLVQLATELGADLLAVGRHTHGPLARILMGETALTTALTAPCDVLVTPPT